MASNTDDRRRKRGDHRRGGRAGPKPQTSPENVDESSPIIQMFLQYREELDARHDKYERLVKLSRDVTIESKRTIFLLHRCIGSNEEAETSILQQAEEKLAEVRATKFLPMAEELKKEDPYQFLRAVSPGLQEYIEAVSFYWFLKHKDLVSLQQLEADLCFSVPLSNTSQPDDAKTSDGDADLGEEGKEPAAASQQTQATEQVRIVVPPVEYILGIADLTGELMRMAINSVGAGNLDVPFQISLFIRLIYDSFVSFGNVNRELNRKISVLRSSLHKVENACYTLKVRGSEIPKHMLADVLSMNPVSSDYAEDHAAVED